MRYFILYLACLTTFALHLNGDEMSVNKLIEEISQTTDIQRKQALIEQVKHELANLNKQAREESKALIDARAKQPSQPFLPPKP